MACEIFPWLKNDAAWFSANPARSYRLRKPFDSEADNLGVEETFDTYVVVMMAEDERTMRLSADWPGNPPLQDSEALAHALFYLLYDGSSFTRRQLAELVQLYRK
jgi:hypothetical protein